MKAMTWTWTRDHQVGIKGWYTIQDPEVCLRLLEVTLSAVKKAITELGSIEPTQNSLWSNHTCVLHHFGLYYLYHGATDDAIRYFDKELDILTAVHNLLGLSETWTKAVRSKIDCLWDRAQTLHNGGREDQALVAYHAATEFKLKCEGYGYVHLGSGLTAAEGRSEEGSIRSRGGPVGV